MHQFRESTRPSDDTVHGSPNGDMSVTPVFDGSQPARHSYRSLVTPPAPVQGPVCQGIVWDEYLEETGLVNIFAGWIKDLVKQADLPYNPYPLLTSYAQTLSEKFHMFDEDDKQILHNFDSQVLSVYSGIFRIQNASPTYWGLSLILKAVDALSLLHYDQLLTISNTDVSVADYDEYSVYKPVAVLVGPCVFCGSIYPQVNIIHIRMEYGVAGPEFRQAVELFVPVIMKDIHDIFREDVHVLLGVTVPVKQQDLWVDKFWTYHTIANQEEDLSLAAVNAAAAGKMITAECMFRLEQDSQVYIRGQKQYNLNFIKTTEAEGSLSTTTQPYLSAFEGIFLSHSTAKEYMSWFAAAAETTVNPSTTTASRGLFGGSRMSNRNRRAPTGLSAPGTSTTSGPNSRLQKRAVENRDVTYSTTGPLAHTVLEKRRNHLQGEMAHFKDKDEFFNMLHCAILLLLLSSKKENAEAISLVEAARMLKSTAYKLHLVMEQNKVLQELVSFFSFVGTDPDVHIVQSHFLSYRRAVKDLFTGSLHARSHDLVAFGKVVLERLDSSMVVNPHSAGSVETGAFPVTSEVIKDLKVVNSYCGTVLLSFINDALSFCPNLLRLLPRKRAGDPSLTSVRLKHGAEAKEIINQERMFLNLEDASKRTSVPAAIAREAVPLQYLVDSRIDETFNEFLLDVLCGSSLPPNPFPRLVSHLRRAAVRMELFGVKRDRLISRLLPNSGQLVTPDNFVYHLPGSEVYGIISAISGVDGKQLNKLRSTLRPLVNKVNARITVSGFKALVDVAVSGFSPLVGRMLPYLHEVDLEEHYFLQGPGHSRNEAIQHFCKLVCDHLVEYSEKEDVLFVGVFLGTPGLRRDLPDLAHPTRTKMFLKQLVATVKAKEPVSMRAYVMMDWRFVPVKKTFLLHYIHGQSMGYERFFNTNNPAAFYQNVFSNKEVASLYSRFCGPQHRGDPCAGENLALSLVHVDHFTERAKEGGNLLEMYRWLLTRSLMSQQTSMVPLCWRMLHSVASQLEYLAALNTTVQRIVCEELSRTFRPVQEDDERQSLLDQSALGSTMEGYINKLEQVLQRATCMAPSGLLPRLTDKLRQITGVDSLSRNLTVVISQQTPALLQEINEILEPLKIAASHDVHSCCPEIVQALES